MPEDQYARLGGDPAETVGRVCLCNGLLSAAGYYSDVEPPIITLGVSGESVTRAQSARQVAEDILDREHVAAMESKLGVTPGG